jgi:hypothetical protein
MTSAIDAVTYEFNQAESERLRCEWRLVRAALRLAQERLQADGSQQSWLDGPITIATERGQK